MYVYCTFVGHNAAADGLTLQHQSLCIDCPAQSGNGEESDMKILIIKMNLGWPQNKHKGV